MALYAVLNEDNVVENIILAEDQESADLATGKTCIKHDHFSEAWIGDLYENGKFSRPVELEETLNEQSGE